MEYQIKKLTDEQIDKLVLESKFPMNSLSIIIPYSYVLKLVNLNCMIFYLQLRMAILLLNRQLSML